MADHREADPTAAEQLLRSDHDYFAAGADEVPFPGGRLLRMPGLEQVPAGCIAVPEAGLASPDSFVAEAVSCASAFGAPMLRFYTPGADDLPEAALLGAGLRRSVEQGFVAATREHQSEFRLTGAPVARVRQVRDGGDWKRKLHLAGALEQLPDGKQAAAAAWTELERRKCEAGYMDAFLIELDGEVCGAFGLASSGRLLRLKNLVVHPDYRRRGLGRTAVKYAVKHAREAGFDWVGAFALATNAGGALYPGCGFTMVSEQVEWARPLPVGEFSRQSLRQIA